MKHKDKEALRFIRQQLRKNAVLKRRIIQAARHRTEEQQPLRGARDNAQEHRS